MKLSAENLLLALVALSFAGFMAGLIGKNTGNAKRKTLRSGTVYKHVTAVSLIVMLLAAFLYSIIFGI